MQGPKRSCCHGPNKKVCCTLAYVGPVEHKSLLLVALSKQSWFAAGGLHELLGWGSPVSVQHVLLVLTRAGQASIMNRCSL
jgi:hypothetical protein